VKLSSLRHRSAVLLALFAAGCTTPQGTGTGSASAPPSTPTSESPKQVGAARGEPVVEVPFSPPSFDVSLPEGVEDKTRSLPMSLTASDGTGLKLVSLVVKAVLDDPFALTELHLTFENPNPRTIEGNFKMVLPSGAALSRFAMKTNDGWQEGEVVEKQAARQAYEDFLHRKQDPALMEQAPGNEFAARVFPIPASSKKEIIISYTQTMPKGQAYELPLQGLPKLGSLSVQVTSYGLKQPIVDITRSNFIPGKDLQIASSAFARGTSVRNDELLIARVVPVQDAPAQPLRNTVFLVDTSASRMLGLKEQAGLLQELIAGLPAEANLAVMAFDQSTEVIFVGKKEGFGDAEKAKLLARGALGASNLGQALLEADKLAGSTKDLLGSRLVLVGDGVATVGETDSAKLKKLLEPLKNGNFERMDTVVVGGLRDEAQLLALVRGTFKNDGVLVDSKREPKEILRRLNLATKSNLKVSVEGASWVYPKTLDGVQPGDEVLVYAEGVSGKSPNVRIGDGPAIAMTSRSVERALIGRTIAQAKIEDLSASTDTSAEGQQAQKRQILELSRRHRVLSKHTAMLVLETDADYKRFDIDRRAKLDIMTVEKGRMAMNHSLRMREEELAALEQAETARSKKLAEAKSDKEGRDSKQKAETEQGSMGRPAPARPNGRFGTEAPADNAPGSGAAATGAAASRAAAEPPSPASDSPKGGLAEEAAKMTGQEAPGSQGIRGLGPHGGGSGGGGSAPAPMASMAPASAPAFARPAANRAPTNRRGLDGDEWSAARQRQAPERETSVAPYTGNFQIVMSSLASGNKPAGLKAAEDWQKKSPSDVMALVALGEAHEASGNKVEAARAYGSILELFSFRADSRRFAGERLERLNTPFAFALASDAFRGAVEQRPDHPASHRLLAFSLLRDGKFEEAFAAMEAGATRTYPDGRFRGVGQILKEDLGLIAQAWIRAEPSKRAEIEKRLEGAHGRLEEGPSVRFVLNWETDANDVDFHIIDRSGTEAYYSEPDLPSGGHLYGDVTTGYGPECFTIRGAPQKRAYPYKLTAHYYSRGPMGYGMGKLQIIEHDGKGDLKFEERPFVIMADNAFVNLGTVTGPLTAKK
jgi:Vault protein inter-alpha-trypsin domain